MNNDYWKKDFIFSFLILSPLLLRLFAEISAYARYPIFDLLKVIIVQIIIYGLAFFCVYLPLYFAREKKKWALLLPYITFLPLLIIVIGLFINFISIPISERGVWSGWLTIALALGFPYLLVNLAIFLFLKKRVTQAFNEGLSIDRKD